MSRFKRLFGGAGLLGTVAFALLLGLSPAPANAAPINNIPGGGGAQTGANPGGGVTSHGSDYHGGSTHSGRHHGA